MKQITFCFQKYVVMGKNYVFCSIFKMYTCFEKYNLKMFNFDILLAGSTIVCTNGKKTKTLKRKNNPAHKLYYFLHYPFKK